MRSSQCRVLVKPVICKAVKEGQESPSGVRSVPRRQRGADCSNLRVLGKGKRVFDVDPEIAHGILDLAMTEKDLDRT